jgi:hypothetical protein
MLRVAKKARVQYSHHAALLFGLLLLITGRMVNAQTVTLRVGQEIACRSRMQVSDVTASAGDPSIVEVRVDHDGVVHLRGLKIGKAKVTARGVRVRYASGVPEKGQREVPLSQDQPFEDVVQVEIVGSQRAEELYREASALLDDVKRMYDDDAQRWPQLYGRGRIVKVDDSSSPENRASRFQRANLNDRKKLDDLFASYKSGKLTEDQFVKQTWYDPLRWFLHGSWEALRDDTMYRIQLAQKDFEEQNGKNNDGFDQEIKDLDKVYSGASDRDFARQKLLATKAERQRELLMKTRAAVDAIAEDVLKFRREWITRCWYWDALGKRLGAVTGKHSIIESYIYSDWDWRLGKRTKEFAKELDIYDPTHSVLETTASDWAIDVSDITVYSPAVARIKNEWPDRRLGVAEYFDRKAEKPELLKGAAAMRLLGNGGRAATGAETKTAFDWIGGGAGAGVPVAADGGGNTGTARSGAGAVPRPANPLGADKRTAEARPSAPPSSDQADKGPLPTVEPTLGRDAATAPAADGGLPTIRVFTPNQKGGGSAPALTISDPFLIEVALPRAATADIKPTVAVTLKADKSGASQSLTLSSAHSPNVGPVVYSIDNPVTLGMGGEGGRSVGIAGYEFSTGGFSRLKVENDDVVHVSYGNAETTFRAFMSAMPLGVAANEEFFKTLDAIYEALLISPGVPKDKQELIHRNIRLIANARKIIAYQAKPDDPLQFDDIIRYRIGAAYRSWLLTGVDAPNFQNQRGWLPSAAKGSLDEKYDVVWVSNQEAGLVQETLRLAAEESHDITVKAIQAFLFTTYQVSISFTGADSFVTAVWGIDSAGQKIDLTTQILAGIGGASQLILATAGTNFLKQRINVIEEKLVYDAAGVNDFAGDRTLGGASAGRLPVPDLPKGQMFDQFLNGLMERAGGEKNFSTTVLAQNVLDGKFARDEAIAGAAYWSTAGPLNVVREIGATPEQFANSLDSYLGKSGLQPDPNVRAAMIKGYLKDVTPEKYSVRAAARPDISIEPPALPPPAAGAPVSLPLNYSQRITALRLQRLGIPPADAETAASIVVEGGPTPDEAVVGVAWARNVDATRVMVAEGIDERLMSTRLDQYLQLAQRIEDASERTSLVHRYLQKSPTMYAPEPEVVDVNAATQRMPAPSPGDKPLSSPLRQGEWSSAPVGLDPKAPAQNAAQAQIFQRVFADRLRLLGYEGPEQVASFEAVKQTRGGPAPSLDEATVGYGIIKVPRVELAAALGESMDQLAAQYDRFLETSMGADDPVMRAGAIQRAFGPDTPRRYLQISPTERIDAGRVARARVEATLPSPPPPPPAANSLQATGPLRAGEWRTAPGGLNPKAAVPSAAEVPMFEAALRGRLERLGYAGADVQASVTAAKVTPGPGGITLEEASVGLAVMNKLASPLELATSIGGSIEDVAAAYDRFLLLDQRAPDPVVRAGAVRRAFGSDTPAKYRAGKIP